MNVNTKVKLMNNNTIYIIYIHKTLSSISLFMDASSLFILFQSLSHNPLKKIGKTWQSKEFAENETNGITDHPILIGIIDIRYSCCSTLFYGIIKALIFFKIRASFPYRLVSCLTYQQYSFVDIMQFDIHMSNHDYSQHFIC